MERVRWRLKLRVCWHYKYYIGVTPTLRTRTISKHVYYVIIMYICTFCILVQWICFHHLYCVVNTVMNTLSDLNGAVWDQGENFYAIETVSTVLCCCCRVFRELSIVYQTHVCL